VIQVNLNSLGWGLVTKRLMEMELRRAITLAEPFFLSGSGVSSYELNRQRNNRINGCNCRGIAVMCVQCTMRIDDNVK
jgi:hypothetical protein